MFSVPDAAALSRSIPAFLLPAIGFYADSRIAGSTEVEYFVAYPVIIMKVKKKILHARLKNRRRHFQGIIPYDISNNQDDA